MKSPELFSRLAEHGPRLVEDKLEARDASADVPARVLRLSIETMLEVSTPNLWEGSLSRIVDFGSQWVAKGEQLSRHREQLARFRPARRRRGVAKGEGAGAPSAGICTASRLAAPRPRPLRRSGLRPALSERLAGK